MPRQFYLVAQVQNLTTNGNWAHRFFSIKPCMCTVMSETFLFAIAIITYNANKHPAVPAVGLGSLQEQIEKNIIDQSCIVSLLRVWSSCEGCTASWEKSVKKLRLLCPSQNKRLIMIVTLLTSGKCSTVHGFMPLTNLFRKFLPRQVSETDWQCMQTLS